ncbi:Yqey-like protein [compost metagenome]
MMSLEKQLREDMKTAMKAGADGKLKLGVIRMLQANISNLKIELKMQDSELEDNQVREIAKSFVKQLKQEIEGLQEGGRDTSFQEAQREVALSYLPVQLNEEQIRAAVDAAILKVGATSKKEMGKVMGALASIRDQADMGIVKNIVQEKLN